MSDIHGHNRRGVKFDPTINLGHILTGAIFLVSTIAAWVSLDARVSQTVLDLKRVEAQQQKESIRIENSLMREITQTQQHLNATQVRTAEDVREIKALVRDGFRELDQKLERKSDKPGR